MFPDSFFGIIYNSNYRKINLILNHLGGYFFFCVFCYYAVFTDLEKNTWEIQSTVIKKEKRKCYKNKK